MLPEVDFMRTEGFESLIPFMSDLSETLAGSRVRPLHHSGRKLRGSYAPGNHHRFRTSSVPKDSRRTCESEMGPATSPHAVGSSWQSQSCGCRVGSPAAN